VCLEWLTDGQLGANFVATVPLFEITEHLITLKNNVHLFPTRESIFNKRVGTIAGYFYFDDNEFIRSDFLNENSLILGLKKQRFKVAILERETAKYWAKRNNTDIVFAALHTSGKLVIRLRNEHSHLLPIINRSIQQLKTTGKLQAILDSHSVDSKIY
jgi:ABC-type amino acid transport substrate-binding protein